MNIFNFSVRAIVFGAALLLGTTAVIASRFVITTVVGFITPAAVPESVTMPAPESERAAVFEDLRNEEPIAPVDFDPTGSYSFDSDEIPRGFADIEYIVITTRDYLLDENSRIYKSIPTIPDGLVEAKRSFEFAKIAVNDREVSFETKSHDGISYQFVGHFPVSTEYINCEGCEYPADLKGQLKKLKNGKVIAEIEAELYVHGC